MNRGYESYCLAHPSFYEAPESARGDDVDFERAGDVPEGWTRAELDDWLVFAPLSRRMPNQGWKIHVSAALDNAERVLAIVWDYCTQHDLAFKFIRSKQLLLMRNSKYADRAASGKFVAIYPADEEQLARVLEELGSLLEGQPGPYILSDLRWGAGPLFVRYGGFAERFCLGADGELVLAIEDPDGELVPDRREPTFCPPDWVALPAFLEPHVEARSSTKVDEVPYRIESALHFSNGGGVYGAVHEPSGALVVLKEARPHAGLDLTGVDAVARLQREADVLRRLHGLEAVPAVLDQFMLGEHHFVALEHIAGAALRSHMADRLPIALEHPDASALEEYAAWAMDMVAQVEATIEAVHARGIVVGDLHPTNIIVRPDGRIALIDLEVACPANEARRQPLADPHFLAPSGVSGVDIDHYALACLRLFMFLPLTALVALSPEKARELAAAVTHTFPVPPAFVEAAVRTISDAWEKTVRHPDAPTAAPITIAPDLANWEQIRHSMTEAVVASATPGRVDRLFPGDIKQFETDGLNLAYGAAGVLLALAESGAERRPEDEDWLVRHATSPEPGVRFGLYDGLHGVAFTLDRLGRREEALKVLDICRHELDGHLGRLSPDLFSGLAGIGLNLLHFAQATDDTLLLDDALLVGRLVADGLGGPEDVPETSGGEYPYAGLVRGSSGPALLFLHLFDHTGEASYLDLAATALKQDLRRCVVREEDGSLEVNEGWRTMPYLADGSVGIGLVLDAYLRRRDDEALASELPRIDLAAKGQFYVEPSLFHGRAGMIAYLAARRDSGMPDADAAITVQVERLNWHALGYRDQLAFPGEELMRLSMDLATGTAGVLLALGATTSAPARLPFVNTKPERR